MSNRISIVLERHLEEFINRQIESGHYNSASDVVQAALRLLEEHETRIAALRNALVEGEKSGDAGEMSINSIKSKAREQASS